MLKILKSLVKTASQLFVPFNEIVTSQLETTEKKKEEIKHQIIPNLKKK
jgi:hypothetical protein